nr:hypothetical protein CFP56_12154 [Quercus suber]
MAKSSGDSPIMGLLTTQPEMQPCSSLCVRAIRSPTRIVAVASDELAACLLDVAEHGQGLDKANQPSIKQSRSVGGSEHNHHAVAQHMYCNSVEAHVRGHLVVLLGSCDTKT